MTFEDDSGFIGFFYLIIESGSFISRNELHLGAKKLKQLYHTELIEKIKKKSDSSEGESPCNQERK